MSNKNILIIFLVVTILVLGGGIMLIYKTSNTPTIKTSQNAKAIVDQKEYNWGNINYSGGNVSKTFTIKNTGTDTLTLVNVKTSCTCTRAQVVINGEASPYFSMHATSSWIGNVASGKEAKLTVIFDPTFHGPSGVGPMTRFISVETNDKNNPKLEFTLTGNVIK